MDRTTRFLAVIGLGGIGSHHLSGMQKLEQRGLGKVVAVVEPRVDQYEELKRELELRGTRWYIDYQTMLCEQSELDAVTISTPIYLHLEMASACIERGLFVNLEKPPVPLIQQLSTLIDSDRGQRVAVGFQMIASQNLQRMKRLIVGGEIGEMRSIRAVACWPRTNRYYERVNWAGKLIVGGRPVFDGPATNALAHLIHNIMFLGSPRAAEFAVPVQVESELYQARPIESYDAACMRGRFPSGVHFSLAVAHCTQTVLPFEIEVRGDKGWLRLSEDGALLSTSQGENLRTTEKTQQLLDACHEQLVNVLSNPDQRMYTSLRDTEGYVRTTNGALMSSGGIHDIDASWVDQYGAGDGAGFDVRGLSEAIGQTLIEGQLFSELKLGWATARPVPVPLDSFETLDLSTYLSHAADIQPFEKWLSGHRACGAVNPAAKSF